MYSTRNSVSYQRLAEKKVRSINGLAVPGLMGYDVELLAIEMEVVHPPYLLDFGKAYIDEPSPYSPGQLGRMARLVLPIFSQALRRAAGASGPWHPEIVWNRAGRSKTLEYPVQGRGG